MHGAGMHGFGSIKAQAKAQEEAEVNAHDSCMQNKCIYELNLNTCA
jgi:hypothetical protein